MTLNILQSTPWPLPCCYTVLVVGLIEEVVAIVVVALAYNSDIIK